MQYSLLYRRPETNGVMEACKEVGATLVAYSPLCQGLLTGGAATRDNTILLTFVSTWVACLVFVHTSCIMHG